MTADTAKPPTPTLDAAHLEAEAHLALEQARDEYVRFTNTARLIGLTTLRPGFGRRLEALEQNYENRWADTLDIANTTVSDYQAQAARERAEREQAQRQDWERRGYVTALEKYHNLSRPQKLAVGLGSSALLGGALTLAGGAAAAACGLTLVHRFSRSYVNRESRRVGGTRAIAGSLDADSDAAANQTLLGRNLSERLPISILDSEAPEDIRKVRQSLGWSVGGIALGRLLSASDALRALVPKPILSTAEAIDGAAREAASVAYPRLEPVLDAALPEPIDFIDAPPDLQALQTPAPFEGLGTESAAVAFFCQINGIDMETLTEEQKALIESGQGTEVIRQLQEAKAALPPSLEPVTAVNLWRSGDLIPASLEIEVSVDNTYTFTANPTHNSVWDLSEHALNLYAVPDPTNAQIATVMNDVLKQRAAAGLSPLLDVGEEVVITPEQLRFALAA